MHVDRAARTNDIARLYREAVERVEGLIDRLEAPVPELCPDPSTVSRAMDDEPEMVCTHESDLHEPALELDQTTMIKVDYFPNSYITKNHSFCMYVSTRTGVKSWRRGLL